MFKVFIGKRNNQEQLYKILIVVSILFFGLMPIFWFKPGYAILAEENFFLNYSNIFARFSNIWGNYELGGKTSAAFLFFPNFIVFRLLSLLHVPLNIQQEVYFILIWFLASLFIYFIVKWHLNSLRDRLIAFVASASIYFLNFDVLYNRPFYTFKSLTLALIPILYLLSLGYVEKKKTYYLVLISLLLFISQSLVLDPATYIITFIVVLVPFVEKVKMPSRTDLFKLSFFVLLPFLYNLLFLYISLYYFDDDYSNKILNSGLNKGLTNNLYPAFNEVINMSSNWWRHKENGADYYFGSYVFYERNIVKAISYVPFLSLIFLYTIFHNHRNKIDMSKRRSILTLFILLFLFIFAAKGLSSPLGFMNRAIYSLSEYAYIFRDARKFYLLTTFLESLIIIRLFKLEFFQKSRLTLGLSILLFIAGIFYSLPVFKGDFFKPRNDSKIGKYTDIKIPSYWLQAANYINTSNNNCRVMTMPMSSRDDYEYAWYIEDAGNARVNLPFYLIDRGLITGNSYFSYSSKSKMLYDLFYEYPQSAFFLGNICFILLQNDVAVHDIPYIPDGYKSIKTIGELELYEYEDPGGILYKTDDFFASNSSIQSLIRSHHGGLRDLDLVEKKKEDIIRKEILAINDSFDIEDAWNNDFDYLPDWNLKSSLEPNTISYRFSLAKESFIYAITRSKLQKANLLVSYAGKRLSESQEYPAYKNLLNDKAFKLLESAKELLSENNNENDFKDDLLKLSKYSKRAYLETNSKNFFELYSTIISELDDHKLAKCDERCSFIEPNLSGFYNLYIDLRPYEYFSTEDIKHSLHLYHESRSVDLPDPEIITNGNYKWVVFKDIFLVDKNRYMIQNILKRNSPQIEPNWHPSANFYDESEKLDKLASTFYSQTPPSKNELYARIIRFEPGKRYNFKISYTTPYDNFQLGIIEKHKNSNKNKDSDKFEKQKIFDYDGFYCGLHNEFSPQSSNDFVEGLCTATRQKDYTFSENTSEAFLYISFSDDSKRNIDFNINSLSISLEQDEEDFITTSSTNKLSNIGRVSIPINKISQYKYSFEISEQNIETPWLLVFKEQFDNGWILYRKQPADNTFTDAVKKSVKWLKTGRIEDVMTYRHRLANGYANAWIVDDLPDLSQDYVLLYYPGLIFEFLKYATCSIIFIIVAYFALLSIKNKVYHD